MGFIGCVISSFGRSEKNIKKSFWGALGGYKNNKIQTGEELRGFKGKLRGFMGKPRVFKGIRALLGIKGLAPVEAKYTQK